MVYRDQVKSTCAAISVAFTVYKVQLIVLIPLTFVEGAEWSYELFTLNRKKSLIKLPQIRHWMGIASPRIISRENISKPFMIIQSV